MCVRKRERRGRDRFRSSSYSLPRAVNSLLASPLSLLVEFARFLALPSSRGNLLPQSCSLGRSLAFGVLRGYSVQERQVSGGLACPTEREPF